nr:ShlB/FhaC/HecB family hemolysin secretion/activation protein [Caballeronia sp. BR00000012568055]
MPAESPCFPISEVRLVDSPFDWLDAKAQKAAGQCIGTQGLKLVLRELGNELIDRGYITSRVTLPEQSLASGVLTLNIAPGKVADIRTEGDGIGTLGAALPSHQGALLNQRDVDQALENIRRLSSQSGARFAIMPGSEAGDSDIVLTPDTGKRWQGVVGYDNAGQKATGKNEVFAALVVDSPFHLYDQLQLFGLTNADRGASGHGTDQVAAGYSVPFGYGMLSLDASRASYEQTVRASVGPVQYTGDQKNFGAKLSAVVQRNAHSRTELRVRAFRSMAANAINAQPTDIQNRDVYGYELGASHRRYVGRAQINASLGWRETLPGLSRNPGYAVGPGFSGREQIETANLSVLAPFRIGKQPFSYRFGWAAQNARTPVNAQDYFTIGTRYSVRGFDQQSTLSAESGWAVSNELDWYAPTRIGTQSVYVGADVGRVRGPTAPFLAGDTLVGAVVGVRGTLAPANRFVGGVDFDVSLGWPLYKPKAYPNKSPTVLVQMSIRI